MSGNICFGMSMFFVRKLLDFQPECDNFMLLCAQDFRIISVKDSFCSHILLPDLSLVFGAVGNFPGWSSCSFWFQMQV
jgi:hypothetical protein